MTVKQVRRFGCALVVAVALIPALFVWNSDLARNSRRLDDDLTLARRLHLPLEPDDLRPKPPVARSQNAAPLLLKVVGWVRSNHLNKLDRVQILKACQGTLPDPAAHRLESRLTVLNRVLPILHDAASRPVCYFDRPWEEGDSLLLPEYAFLTTLSRAACAQASFDIRAGRNDRTLRTLRDVATACRFFSSDVFAFGVIAANELEVYVGLVLSSYLSGNASTSSKLSLCNEIAKLLGPVPSIRHCIGSAVVLNRLTSRDPAQIRQLAQYRRADAPLWTRYAIFQRANEALIVREYGALWSMTQANPIQFHRLKALVDDWESKELTRPGDSSWLLKDSLPVWDGVVDSLGRMQAHRAVLSAVQFALKTKIRSGRYPDLLPLDLSDPFTDGPLKYTVLGKDRQVYSIGSNGIDDHGEPIIDGGGSEILYPDVALRFR